MLASIMSQRQVQLANTVSQQPKERNMLPHNMPTYICLAVGFALSVTSMQVQAADDTQTYNELPVDSKAAQYNDRVNKAVEVMNNPEYVTRQTMLFIECQELQSSPARLACYDKVAEQGKVSTATLTKQPVDLARTFKKTISGNPQVVLAGESDLNNSDAENVNATAEQNNAGESESLDTVGLTEREAQVLEDVGVTQSDIEKYTALSLAYDLDQNSERGKWTLRPHNPNYVLPLFYTFDPNLNPSTPSQEGEAFTSNEIRNTELKFQLSLKTKVGEDLFGTSADLWFGYTQQSHWQVYNEDNSRPFRATDYQPEIFLTQPVTADLPFGGRLRMLGAGFKHHSNGKSDPLSRSWNRIYLMGGAEWGKFSVVPRLWARVNNESADSEDNPDIEDFMGYGDIKFLYDLPKQQSISGTLRYNPSTNKGAAQLDYIYPLTENVNGYVQLFQGYGESIINYNHEDTAIGVGIVLNDWKGF